jgi:type IV secretion system protein VirD4
MKLLILVIFACEGISWVTLQLLNCPNIPWPWTFLQVLQHRIYWEPLISVLVTGVVFLIVYGLYQGGFLRYIVTRVMAMLLGIGLTGEMGLLLYQWVDVIPSLLWSEALSALVMMMLIGLVLFEDIRPANRVLGNAHFAKGWEVYKDSFYKKEEESLIIGKKSGLPLYSNQFEHVLVFAPSGSGKTRSITIPNLFHFPYSVVCNDIKFTLFETTSGYRSRVLGHECYCFAPTKKNGVTHRFNPLKAISKNKLERLTDIQQIAHIFMPDNPKEQSIWTQASRKLFKILVLYLLDSESHPTTLGAMNRLIKQEHFDAWLQEVLDTTDHFDPEFYRNGYSYLNNHEKTRQGIVETFTGYFELFDDPFVDAATSESDFNFADLRRKKITIYVGFTDEDMERLAPLLTLFWQQLISTMIKEVPNLKQEPYPLLCLIDEFSSLGRIERLRRSLKLLREYRVRCILLFQYIAQTYEKYSHDEAKAFINIKTKIAYTTEDLNDAEFISKMLGTRTKKVVTRSVTNQQQGASDGKNINYQAIPLMRPDEIMKMPSSIALLMRSGCAPIKAKQFIWYQESAMKNLVQPPAAVPQQIAKQSPFVRKPMHQSLLESMD